MRRRAVLAVVSAVVVGLAVAGCGGGGESGDFGSADTTTGKRLFQEKCGSCHTLADAGTRGQVGPNLDDGLGYAKQQGFEESTLYEVVLGQIHIPNEHGAMPANIVTGDDAVDVAAYVAKAAKQPPGGEAASR